ncbi:hypothetical protein Q2T40_07915 [Winogradskyella maritima]|uniref:Uncharacterized protein n=1 Tax=Winogradskyella maritima TaxID=1517766 RepID=A0ABV8AN17_9FLAO|nr:hypothetical protein [Winogradskyella maritima]
MKKSIVPFLAIFMAVSALSCKDLEKDIDDITNPAPTSENIGSTHYLNEDGIKIVLPDGFKKLSAYEYEQILKKIAPKKQLDAELKRLKEQRTMDGNFYLFFDEASGSTYTANTIPYTPISRKDATNLLSLIRKNQEEFLEDKNTNVIKVTAKYSAGVSAEVFKAIFKVDNTKTKTSYHQTGYFISSNDKTVMINLTTRDLVDFDPYIQKMVF